MRQATRDASYTLRVELTATHGGVNAATQLPYLTAATTGVGGTIIHYLRSGK